MNDGNTVKGRDRWKISPITEQDIPAAAMISREAFIDSDINKYIRPLHKRRKTWAEGELLDNTVRRFTRLVRDNVAMKATLELAEDENPGSERGVRPRIAGLAVWTKPAVLEEYSPVHVEMEARDVEVDYDAQNRFNVELSKRSMELCNEQEESGQKFFALITLATDSAYRGRGVASALVRWGLEHAAQRGVRALVESVPAAEPVYIKAGYRRRGEFTLPYDVKDAEGNPTGERRDIKLVTLTVP